ncbi:MAG: amidohydrolase family protein [Victivallales bacterium]|nr:amidohydrolase family protein [Victivallales bacterium]
MILDIHTHNFKGHADEVAASAAAHGIDRFIFLGDVLRYGDQPTPEQIRQLNNETQADVRSHFDHCRGFCFLNPDNPPEFLVEEANRCLDMPEFIGIKMEVCTNCRSTKLDPFMKILEERNLPLLHHCWYKTTGKHRFESDPSDIADLARRFPKVKIVMAHLCGIGIRGVEDVVDCPNVCIDTSGAQPEAGLVEYAVKRIGAERIVYGSDATCRTFGAQLAKIREADITEAERKLIFCDNARRLLGW